MELHNIILKDMAKKFVGDGGSPNIFFVTEGVGANTLAVLVGDHCENQAVYLAKCHIGPAIVEDRKHGVVFENEEFLHTQMDG